MPRTFNELVEDLRIDLVAELDKILAQADEDDAEIGIADVASDIVAMLQRRYVQPYIGIGNRVFR